MIELLRTRPLVGQVDGILSPDEVAELSAALTPDALAAAGLPLEPSDAGQTQEIPLELHPLLPELAERITAAVGLEHALEPLFRLRWAGPGHSHPLHTDDYEIDGANLRLTALVYLTEVEGGCTMFPHAEPPLSVAPRAGQLVAWYNLGPDDHADPLAEHAFEAVAAGDRLTLTWFVYATAAAAKAAHMAHPNTLVGQLTAPPEPATAGALHCIDEDVPRETLDSLRRACATRGLRFVRVQPEQVTADQPPLPPGTLLYTPATSLAAERAEQQLWQPGVGTFHRRPEGPFVTTLNPLMAFARAGLPVPRFTWIRQADRASIDAAVEALGGLPLVLKAGPGEGGVGTLRADTLPGLYSLLDLLLSRRSSVLALAYVPDALHLRLIVVGEEVITAYRNPTMPNDFRSEPAAAAQDYGIEVDPEWATVAVQASHVVGYAFAGVDLLVHPSGRCYLLEANFPCYFPQAEVFGADVAGAMLDYLQLQAQ